MSFAYYSSGERDEETGEYILPETRAREQSKAKRQGERVDGDQSNATAPVVYPPEFDEQFFRDRQNEAKSNSRVYDWLRYMQYMNSICAMYPFVAYKFYAKYAKDINSLKLPDYIMKVDRTQNGEILASNLDGAERTMIAQFAHNRREVQTCINRYKRLERLQNYGVKAWLMYYTLYDTLEIPLKNSLRFKAVYENLNQAEPLDQLRIYRGCKIMARNFRVHLPKNLMASKGHYLYQDVDISKIYDEIIASIGGMTAEECQEILTNIRPKITQLKEQDKEMKAIIDFYHYFDDLKRTIYEINRLGADWQENGGRQTFLDSSYGDNVDVYLCGEKYKEFCTKILPVCKKYDQIFVRDVEMVLEELQYALSENETAHTLSRPD